MKVLLATDGSDSSMNAAKFVEGMARNNEIEVIVLTVTYTPNNQSMQPWLPEWTKAEEKRIGEFLDETRELLSPCCDSVTVLHESGATVPCILDQASATEADLIVLGAVGHSAVRRVLLGSVSDSIATHAKCSVLIVRPTVESENAPHNIVVGFDNSAASSEAVAELLELKWAPETEINVVSVVEQPFLFFGEGYAGPPMTVEPKQREAVRCEAERIASSIASDIPNTTTQTPTSDHAGSAIVEAAEGNHANLVLVGESGHSLVGEMLLGSTSKYVLRHAPCSVWISRHHQKAGDSVRQEKSSAASS
ncbi:MAG: universal stress protein [Rubripirellula sp.]